MVDVGAGANRIAPVGAKENAGAKHLSPLSGLPVLDMPRSHGLRRGLLSFAPTEASAAFRDHWSRLYGCNGALPGLVSARMRLLQTAYTVRTVSASTKSSRVETWAGSRRSMEATARR